PAAAGAAWAKAEEMNTVTPGRNVGRKGELPPDGGGPPPGGGKRIVCGGPRGAAPPSGCPLGSGRAAAPLLHQALPLRPHGGEVALLDVAVAADLLAQVGDLDGEGVVGARQAGDQLLHRGPVLLDEGALGAALPGAAEDVQRR